MKNKLIVSLLIAFLLCVSNASASTFSLSGYHELDRHYACANDIIFCGVDYQELMMGMDDYFAEYIRYPTCQFRTTAINQEELERLMDGYFS